MIGSVLSFLGGVGDFTSYVTMYFRNKDIKDTQREIGVLINRIAFLEESLKDSSKNCESIVEALNIEHSIETEMLKAEYVSNMEVNKKSRRISG